MEETNNISTSMIEKQQSSKSPTNSSNSKTKSANSTKASRPLTVPRKREKALCVTPTEGNSQSLVKRTKPNQSSNHSKVESNRLKPLLTKHRKRKKEQSPLIKKRSKVQSDDSQRSVPSEILAFDDVQLSPLDSPNLFLFPKSKQQSKFTTSGSRSSSKSFQSFGRKKRKIAPRTYGGRKKKTFDVMDSDDIFRF